MRKGECGTMLMMTVFVLASIVAILTGAVLVVGRSAQGSFSAARSQALKASEIAALVYPGLREFSQMMLTLKEAGQPVTARPLEGVKIQYGFEHIEDEGGKVSLASMSYVLPRILDRLAGGPPPSLLNQASREFAENTHLMVFPERPGKAAYPFRSDLPMTTMTFKAGTPGYLAAYQPLPDVRGLEEVWDLIEVCASLFSRYPDAVRDIPGWVTAQPTRGVNLNTCRMEVLQSVMDWQEQAPLAFADELRPRLARQGQVFQGRPASEWTAESPEGRPYRSAAEVVQQTALLSISLPRLYLMPYLEIHENFSKRNVTGYGYTISSRQANPLTFHVFGPGPYAVSSPGTYTFVRRIRGSEILRMRVKVRETEVLVQAWSLIEET